MKNYISWSVVLTSICKINQRVQMCLGLSQESVCQAVVQGFYFFFFFFSFSLIQLWIFRLIFPYNLKTSPSIHHPSLSPSNGTKNGISVSVFLLNSRGFLFLTCEENIHPKQRGPKVLLFGEAKQDMFYQHILCI